MGAEYSRPVNVCVGKQNVAQLCWSSSLILYITYIYLYIYLYKMHNLTQLCCPICMNISILGHILPADPAVSLCRAWFLAAAELCSNYAAAPGRGTQTASVSLGCSSPGCLWKAAIALPALPPWQAVPGVGLRLAQCPSGVAVIGVPRRGSQRGQQRVLWRSRLRPAPCGALRLPPWHGTVSLTCAGGVGSG